MNYVRLIPLMLFPYAYLIYLALCVNFTDFLMFKEDLYVVTVIVYLVLTLFCTIFGAIYAGASKLSPKKAAKLNLVVKLVQIPAYIFHFLMGLAGSVMSVWGIGLIMLAVAIDLMTILLTGIHAIGCNVKCCRAGVISKKAAVFMSIGSFIYCIDIVVAIVLVVIARDHKEEFVKNGEINAV